MKKRVIKKPFICENTDGKKFKVHKWDDIPCDCPLCPEGSHKVCIRCWIDKELR